MSEWERLRDAMRATERPDTVLDLTLVMREGRRLRTRRRCRSCPVSPPCPSPRTARAAAGRSRGPG